ncbi:MAG: nitrite/sulfite reductase [Saprospiraceae bacterium]|nr:nitrite/sulfite reductase [Saprospiraceae bacterium]
MSTMKTTDIRPDLLAQDIEELSAKVNLFQTGQMHEERFQHYRLTRGVYGQRQVGVQMFRTKIPYGKVTIAQLRTLAHLARTYGHNNLHITTRQNIQLHYVKLENSVHIWEELAKVGMNAMGACGNTVRNITASPEAGIDPNEPFDVSPYVEALYAFFLRNPICQDMGRKIKIAFSSSDADSGYTYFHDFGFIPRIRGNNGTSTRGFKIVVGGGLGAVSIPALTIHEFLPADEIIPFTEAAIRVFDRYGERQKRQKARMKFLVKKLGLAAFKELVQRELEGVSNAIIPIPATEQTWPQRNVQSVDLEDPVFAKWFETNVFEQKQKGFYAAFVKVHLGDLSPEVAEKLAAIVAKYAADDIRFTAEQNLLLRFIDAEDLPSLHRELSGIGLGDAGIFSAADVTSCPGTDTCALGVTNSTGLATELKDLITQKYPDLLSERDIHIKISGCMNSCGQHMAAAIGFHGSSIKKGPYVIPAMQVVLGGGLHKGVGHMAQKVIKLPTKRIPAVVETLLEDFAASRQGEEPYILYVLRQGKAYFYDLLKPLADIDGLKESELFDWGQNSQYVQEIGVGECAGVAYDMVGAILGDAIEQIEKAELATSEQRNPEARYHAYTAHVIAAKGWLLSHDVACNTQIKILEDFAEHAIQGKNFAFEGDFVSSVLTIRDQPANHAAVLQYVKGARLFVESVIDDRASALGKSSEKLVIRDYYKA